EQFPEALAPALPAPRDGGSEARERRARVERTTAAAEDDLADEREATRVGHTVDRPRDHVRDEDAEADDVRHETSPGRPLSSERAAAIETARAARAWEPVPCSGARPSSTHSTKYAI